MEAKVAYNTVLEKIVEKYIANGWKYSKSSHWMTKKNKKFKYKISFYTSYNNISDIDVALYASFSVESNKTKEFITGLSTGNCGFPKGKLQWNIATEDTWENAINEITEWIENYCFPLMDEFENNLEEYVAKVVKEGFHPEEDYTINIGFIVEFGTNEQVEEAIKRYYESLSDETKVEFKTNYESMIVGGPAVSSYGERGMLNRNNYRTIIENKIVVDLNDTAEYKMLNRFVVDKMDKYLDKATEIYCELYSVSKDELTYEQLKDIELHAANHIGFFVSWVIKHNFIGEKYKDNVDVDKVKEETMTGTEFILKYGNGKFFSDDVSEELLPFIKEYYLKNYFRDYCGWVINELCDLPMEFIGTWEDYYEFEAFIDNEYERISQ